jgi:hypothetical protein
MKIHRHIPFLFCAFAIFSPALADTGPCKPHPSRDVVMCGSGDGAAIVIRDTTSPSGKLALAWRVPDAPPTEMPDFEKLQLLVLRLSDGKILSQTGTEYWDTGEMHANHPSESAYWSPDSRFLVREFNSRYSSDIVGLYAFGAKDEIAGPFDLLKLLEPVLREKLKTQIKIGDKNKDKDAEDFVFILAGKENKPAVTIDPQGNIRAGVTFWAPKNGPTYYYDATLKTVREKGALEARIVSVRYRGMETSD